MKNEKKKNQKPEAIIKEIEANKEKASALTIKAVLKVIKEYGRITGQEIEEIATRQAWSFFEMSEDDKAETAKAAYNNTIEYLNDKKGLSRIAEGNRLYNVFSRPATDIDGDTVMFNLTLIVAEYRKIYNAATEEGDVKAQLQALKMVNTITTALRIRARTIKIDNLKEWLRLVLPTSDQYKYVDSTVTISDLHDKMMYTNANICDILADLNDRVKGLIATEMADRYGRRVMDIYDKQLQAYTIKQHTAN